MYFRRVFAEIPFPQVRCNVVNRRRRSGRCFSRIACVKIANNFVAFAAVVCNQGSHCRRQERVPMPASSPTLLRITPVIRGRGWRLIQHQRHDVVPDETPVRVWRFISASWQIARLVLRFFLSLFHFACLVQRFLSLVDFAVVEQVLYAGLHSSHGCEHFR